MSALSVVVDPELAGRVRLGVVALEGLEVRAEAPELRAEIARYGGELRARHPGARSGDVPGVDEARRLYRSLGLDPTKNRPSNEALLRRVLRDEELYVVNSLVDALNLCSLREQLPFGLYDRARLAGRITLRRGLAGEGYEGIRKARVNVGGRPVLVDDAGPFGNPTSDSARTCITTHTREALVTAYAPGSWTDARLSGLLDRTAETLVRFSGGRVVGQLLPVA